MLVSVSFFIKKGRNFNVRSTKQEKLMVICECHLDKSTFSGSAKLAGLWIPELRNTQSRSGYALVMLGGNSQGGGSRSQQTRGQGES